MARNRYLRRRNRRFYRPRRRWLEFAAYAGVAFGFLLIALVCYFEFVAPPPPVDALPPLAARERPVTSTPLGVPLGAPFDAPFDASTTVPGEGEPEHAVPGESALEHVPPDDAARAEERLDVFTAPAPSEEEKALGADDPLFAEPFFRAQEGEEEMLAEAEEDATGVIHGVISEGDTAGVLLQDWLGGPEMRALVNACKNVHSLNLMRLGQPYSLHRENGQLVRFEYEINTDRRLVAMREERDGVACWTAVVEEIEYDVQLVRVEGDITSTLFEGMQLAGEGPNLAVRLAEIFAWEINFIRDIRPGDSFRLLVEKRYRDGEFKGYGKMYAAEFVNKKSKFEAYLFEDSLGNSAYFNAAGDSLKRAFLKAPLSYTRISSRFNLRRMHPILNTVRPHPAMDYAAPSGTPVKAIGGGVVAFRGYGKGAGNYVVLKHTNGYESMYLHLSGFAKNLKKGGRVRQGEVIGYVGSTGYSTGPHLDFRMKKNGQFLNPEKVLSPRDESVARKRLPVFKAERDRLRRFMEGEIALSEFRREEETVIQ